MLNWLKGGAVAPIASLTVQEAWERIGAGKKGAGPVLLDVREPGEYARGHARGARNLPLGQLAQRVNDVPKDRDVLVICQSGHRSSNATRLLLQSGYTRVWNVTGGTTVWRMCQLPMDQR